MDHRELNRSGGSESNGITFAFRSECPPSRLWEQPAPSRPDAARGPYVTHPATDGPGTSASAIALESDHSVSIEFELGQLWRRLGAREWRVRNTFATARDLHVVVDELPAMTRASANDAGFAMIEQVLLGRSSKAVAIDRHVSDSTVALAIKKRLRLMGLSCKVRAMPLILALAARAACGRRQRVVLGRIVALGAESSKRSWVISVAQPEFRFPRRLSAAERAVLLQVLEGKSYVQIAAARATSLRTVANQLAAVFRKLGVSGYGETLDLLLSRTLGGEASTHTEGRVRQSPLMWPSPRQRAAAPAH